MNYRKLGGSGLLVSELALGTMVFGENSERSTPPEKVAPIIDRYLDEGGNHIDTANVYAGGRSEELVGAAIKTKRKKIILATKVRFPMGNDPNEAGLSRFHILQSVEDSLRRLHTDTIDLLYMHCWDPKTPIEESLRAFDDLVRSGKVRYIGVSNFKAWQVMKAICISKHSGWENFIAAQYQYSLVERNIETEFIDLCIKEGLGIVPWGPLGGGFLTGKYLPDQKPMHAEEGRIAVMESGSEESWENRNSRRNWEILDVVDRIAKSHNASYSQVSLAWLLKKPAVSSVIIGVRTLDQLEDNLGSVNIDLSDDDINRLDQVSMPDIPYPYGFINTLGQRP